MKFKSRPDSSVRLVDNDTIVRRAKYQPQTSCPLPEVRTLSTEQNGYKNN
jgi:hypothetical protein